jgi:GNAT superfamily N-acetyltransferase
MIEIKQAAISDITAITPLFNAYRLFYNQKSDPIGACNFITERLTKKESIIFLAYYNKLPAGFVQLYPIFSSVSMQQTWLLNDLFVADDYRQKGIGQALLTAAASFGKQQQAKWLLLQTGALNTNAQKLYEKNGWKKETDFFYVLGI